MTIPLIHITDLYHPPQDPDDHLDLATIVGLQEFDLKAVVLDITRRFIDGLPGEDFSRDPGFVPVAQIGYIAGKAIPAAIGPPDPLKGFDDDVRDRPIREQAGIELLLEVLRSSPEPVYISVVGSVRVLAAAYNREPELLKEKTRTVLLNAGATAVHKEWNVILDQAAYVTLWRSGLPIDWYPCASENGGFDTRHPHNTCWQSDHRRLFRNLPGMLAGWFCHAYTGSMRGDIIRALNEQGYGSVWEHVLSAKRYLWSTASLILSAGRHLARTREGWRFLPGESQSSEDIISMDLVPITAAVTDDGVVEWKYIGNETAYRLFRRQPDGEYESAMTEALNALLCSVGNANGG
jgi:pyrimidine-specific ribonucleoside hydrolase